MQSRILRKYLGLSASVLLLASNSAWAAQTLEYSIRWDTKDDRYHVFMKPTVTPTPKDMSMTGQVTILVPHASGADSFVVDDPRSMVTNTTWSNDSRVDAPPEKPIADYISFSLSVIKSDAFAWKAGEEKEVLNFRNSGACIGPVSLIENATDPFNAPVLTGSNNSATTNPGNHFTNLGWGSADENNYKGNYGTNSANCKDSLDSDGDGLKDGDETTLGTNPNNPDSDGDGLPDGVEVNDSKTDPMNPDTDGDGINDKTEVGATP
ncbi:MAG: thrombospondin type 3 repeat-containing protein, partial [Gammaproteobacteria bacterium]|nr:thrombospondin type 3 repeat-containing protein [Gammaproteobacteria bacterium]